MSATVKCRYCKKEIKREEAYHEEGSTVYYCSLVCQNSALQKRRNGQAKNYKSVKGTDRRLTTDYIVKIYTDKGIDEKKIPWDLIGSQMKNMVNEHKDWNYSTLHYTLWFMYEIKGMDLLGESNNQSPLNLIPYYILEAKDYWESCNEINKQLSDFEFKEAVVLKASRRKDENKTKLRYKKITF